MICLRKVIDSLILFTALVLVPLLVWAQEVEISKAIEENIEKLVQEEPMAYKLDLSRHKATQQRIDEVFSKYFDFEKAEGLIGKDRKISTYKLPAAKSRQIMLKDHKREIKLPMDDSNVWYLKGPFKRSYIKEVNVPAEKELSDKRAGSIARKFIVDNDLCIIKDADKMSPPIVRSRKRTLLMKDGKKGETQIMFKRVEFKRVFQGMEVFNSKQMVDIYPDNFEIVAYNKINWTEVDISTRKKTGFLTKEELISKINTTIGSSQKKYSVTKVEKGFYQTDKEMIPIMAVHTEKKADQKGVKPIQEVFLISLGKGLVIEKPQKDKEARPLKVVKPK